MKAAPAAALALALMMAPTLGLSPALAADQRTLTMGGHGEAKAAPDLVSINAGVTTSAPTADVQTFWGSFGCGCWAV